MNSNMYNWIDKTYNPLAGECSHKCSYCWVNNLKKRSPEIMKKYSGEPRLDKNTLKKKVPRGTHFLCSCNDLFADVQDNIIMEILRWANNQDCQWVIQTKDPYRMLNYIPWLPKNCIVGTTIETNRDVTHISKGIHPETRAKCISMVDRERFLTIEPIMSFDLELFLELIKLAKPNWVNVGCDSKNNHLPEPSAAEVQLLIEGIKKLGIEIRKKANLERLDK